MCTILLEEGVIDKEQKTNLLLQACVDVVSQWENNLRCAIQKRKHEDDIDAKEDVLQELKIIMTFLCGDNEKMLVWQNGCDHNYQRHHESIETLLSDRYWDSAAEKEFFEKTIRGLLAHNDQAFEKIGRLLCYVHDVITKERAYQSEVENGEISDEYSDSEEKPSQVTADKDSTREVNAEEVNSKLEHTAVEAVAVRLIT